MKKLLFAFVAVAFISSAYSCKECGYCQYPNGSRSGEVCQNKGALSATEELVEEAGHYIISEANCTAQDGVWVVTE
jgi:hypothetical protein